jgi:pimeloyl-ACP methyl ester carboxylesterase
LARFVKDKVTADMIGEKRFSRVQVLRARYKTDAANLKKAKKYLTSLLPLVPNNGRRKIFKEVGDLIRANLNSDTLPRLEGFIGQAEQWERNLAKGKRVENTGEEILALALSGWLMGNDLAETKVDWAMKLWSAREFLLKYLKTPGEAKRKDLVDSFGKRPPLAMDELAQMIRLLPPIGVEENDKENGDGKNGSKVNGIRKNGDLYQELKTVVGRSGQNYLVQLPPEYHPHRAYPVLFVLHGGGGEAKAILKRWSKLAAENGYILAAPQWGRGLSRQYQFSEEEHGAVTEVLRDLRRRFQVDSDRIFLFGYGEGGVMAYDIGLSHPDLFAGVIPMCGAPKYYAFHYKPNAQYLPFYIVDGGYNSNNSETHQKVFKEWVRYHYPALFVEYRARGPEFFEGELPYIFKWMSYKKRARPRKELGLDGGGGLFGHEFKTFRSTDNSFYWLSTSEVKDAYTNEPGSWKAGRRPATLTARVGANNLMFVSTKGVPDVTVWFPPALLNYEKPATIRVNGTVVWNKKVVPQSMATMLEDFFQRGDRQRLYLAKLTFRLK